MKKKTYIQLMTATVLASTLLLGACGNKKETTQASSSAKTSQSSSTKASSANNESKTQKSSTLSTSEKPKVSSDKSSTTATQTQAANASATEQRKGQDVATQQAASQQTATKQTATKQQSSQAQVNQKNYDSTTDRKFQDKQAEQNKRYKGVLTMVDGDFSAAAGNWKGANGETITVSSGGQFTVETADGKKENYSIKGYSYTLDDGKYNATIGGGKTVQITTGADGKVSSVALSQ